MKRIAMFVMACLICVGVMVNSPLEAAAAGYYPASAAQGNCEITGHTWVTGVNQNGVAVRLCTVCQENEVFTSNWIPLTECERLNKSNEDGHFADLRVGKWDSRAGKLPNAIRFCVSNKKDYRNTHYVNYRVKGQFDILSGVISYSNKSEKFATARVLIYFDNELAYESGIISANSEDAAFILDVSDVDVVRVVCATTDVPSAYCVVSASVY